MIIINLSSKNGSKSVRSMLQRPVLLSRTNRVWRWKYWFGPKNGIIWNTCLICVLREWAFKLQFVPKNGILKDLIFGLFYVTSKFSWCRQVRLTIVRLFFGHVSAYLKHVCSPNAWDLSGIQVGETGAFNWKIEIHQQSNQLQWVKLWINHLPCKIAFRFFNIDIYIGIFHYEGVIFQKLIIHWL